MTKLENCSSEFCLISHLAPVFLFLSSPLMSKQHLPVLPHCLAVLLILTSNVNDEEGHGSGGFAVHLGIFFVPLLTEFYYNCHQVAEVETTASHEQAMLDKCMAYVCGAYVRVC